MVDVQLFLRRYNEVWNEPDAERRRRRIAELWTEEGAHYMETNAFVGHVAIEDRIRSTYERYVGTGEYIFEIDSSFNYHHDAVRLRWFMVPQSGGNVVAAGTVFILLDQYGRIQTDYQFSDAI
ncbi:hypothetical protein PAESOLCIP111_05246 [Paenibacillus solanacearum]|uniref:Nuclear transport factor 2 family protein n=1 Tax=Paenibacillus solanacearum TaxID=2048548 RepID=A0A916NL78_9BACL|nr:hypothetical protein [Paenibacillus solanacearum]CAG7646811.1 hypothetical protein PAESOLCIP111_05246 [Paenibacillus solanacearum]